MLKMSGSLEVVTVTVTLVSGSRPALESSIWTSTSPTVRVPISDHCYRQTLDVPMPLDAGLGVPLDHNRLSNGEAAKVRLVKISSHALVVQVGHLKQQFACLGKLGGRGVQTIDRPRHRRVVPGLSFYLPGRVQAGSRIFHGCLGPRNLLRRKPVARAVRGRIEACLCAGQPLLSRRHFSG